MQIRIFKDGQQRGPYSSDEVCRFIDNGTYNLNDLGWDNQKNKWVPLTQLLNISPAPSGRSLSHRIQTTPPSSSAVKAGWICLGLGICTFWFFGIGFTFFSVTIILSIFAMCTNQVKEGVILLVSSLVTGAVCSAIFFFLILGASGAVAKKLTENLNNQMQQIKVPPPVTFSSLQSPITFSTPIPSRGRFIKPTEFLNSKEAMTARDISALLGSGIHQSEIIQEVHERGLAKAIVGYEANQLSRVGATPALISELGNYDYVLTDDEYQNYLNRVSKRDRDAANTHQAQQLQENQKKMAELAEQQRLQQEHLANVAKMQQDASAKAANDARMDNDIKLFWLKANDKNSRGYLPGNPQSPTNN
jgi:DNA-binding phage protein